MCGREARRADPHALFLHRDKNCMQLLLQVKNVSFLHEHLEPLYCSLAIYDLTNRRKISENFYFDGNSGTVRGLLGQWKEREDAATLVKKAVFNVSQPHVECYLVLRVDKLVQGDVEEAQEPYIRSEKLKEKDIEKHKQQIKDKQELFPKFGNHRQVFGWAYMPLFDQSAPRAPVTLKYSAAQQQQLAFKDIYPLQPRDNIIDLITQLKDPKKEKSKLKTLHGTVEFRLQRLDKPLPHILDPMLAPVKYWPESEVTVEEDTGTAAGASGIGAGSGIVSKPAASASSMPGPRSGGVMFSDASLKPDPETDLAREVAELPLPSTVATIPFWTYMNNMYVYPESVNLSGQKAKNIGVRMLFRDGDEDALDLGASGLPVFYGKSACLAKSKESRTQVTFHNKEPVFSDEVKIALPARLHGRHHIVFAFHALNLEPEKKKKEEAWTEQVIGFAVLPVYMNQRLIENATFALSVVLLPKLEPRYLQKMAADAAHTAFPYAEGGKAVFRVRLEALSTVYVQDAVLASLGKVYHFKEFFMDEELKDTLDRFSSVPNTVAMQHLPLIILELLTIMGIRSNQPGLQSFKALVLLLNKVQGKLKPDECRPARAAVLTLIADHTVDIIKNAREQPYKSLSGNILMFLMEKRMDEKKIEALHGESVSIEDAYQVIWWIFEVITKCLALRLCQEAAGTATSATPTPTPTPTPAPTAAATAAGGPGAAAAVPPEMGVRHDIALSRLLRKLVSAIAKQIRFSMVQYWPSAPNSTPVGGAGGPAGAGAAEGAGDKKEKKDKEGGVSVGQPQAPSASTDKAAQGPDGQPLVQQRDWSYERKLLEHVNRSLALFVKDLLNLLDRGHVVEMVASVIAEYTEVPAAQKDLTDNVYQFKWDFIRIVYDHEHLVPLNCPVMYSVADVANYELTNHLSKRHPLATLLVRTMLVDLKRRRRAALAVSTFADLLCKHDYDARYQYKEARERIALTYFVLLPMLIEDHALLKPWREAPSDEENRALYMSMVFIIRNCKDQVLAWFRKESPGRLITFCELLAECIDTFEFNPNEKKIPEWMLRQKGIHDEILMSGASIPIDEKHKFRNAKLTTECALHVLYLVEDMIHAGKHFSLPAGVLDMRTGGKPADAASGATVSPRAAAAVSPRGLAMSQPNVVAPTGSAAELPNKIFGLWVRILKRRQSEFTLACMYGALATFVWKFRPLVYHNGNWCSDLLREVIRHCAFTSERIRSQATAFLYTFIKQNFFTLNHFGRVSIQATMALYTLDNEGELTKDDRYLKRALATLAKYSLYDYGGTSVTLVDRDVCARARARARARALLLSVCVLCAHVCLISLACRRTRRT